MAATCDIDSMRFESCKGRHTMHSKQWRTQREVALERSCWTEAALKSRVLRELGACHAKSAKQERALACVHSGACIREAASAHARSLKNSWENRYRCIRICVWAREKGVEWGARGRGGHGRGHRGKGKQEHSGAHCHMISVVSDETSTIGIFKPAHMSFSENLSGKCENATHILQ
jgi:hypothetical protein